MLSAFAGWRPRGKTRPVTTTEAEPSHRLGLFGAGGQLLIASFVVLFQELTLIRWLPTQIRVLAYFPNVVLISAFLGLGLGSLRTGKRSLAWLWPVMTLILVAAASALRGIAFTQKSATEHLWLLYYDLPRNAPVVPGVRLPIVLFFILGALTFLPLGQLIGERLSRYRQHHKSLSGYAWDLGGSLAGVVSFAIVSYVGLFPIAWFAIIGALGSILFFSRPKALAIYVLALAVTLTLVVRSESAEFYSPYYSLNAKPCGGAVEVLANRSFHQIAATVRNDSVISESDCILSRKGREVLRFGYHEPYRRLLRKPRQVLVLGAGSGNDVAVALDEGAQHVDAVEIDPIILEIGQRMHPEQPYSDPRVTLINADARSFLNTSPKKYDLIVFGTLDSMTRLSALSNVRLDNFVYTRESIKAARQHLTPDGGMALYFMVGNDYIDRHLDALVLSAFGDTPVVVAQFYEMFNRIFLAGPAFEHLRDKKTSADIKEQLALEEIPTDDWPYLYLEHRSISTFYLSLIGVFATLALAGVVLASSEFRKSLVSFSVDWVMALFGAAFLLLETKLVTEMNLIWGATWLTSSVVFGSILLMILIGTLLTPFIRPRFEIMLSALVLSLIVTYFIPASSITGFAPAPKLVLSILYAGLPIFFASLCFAVEFKERAEPSIAFGWNLLGAVAGGLIEFASMAIGLRALTLVAAAAYLAAFLIRVRGQSIAASSASA